MKKKISQELARTWRELVVAAVVVAYGRVSIKHCPAADAAAAAASAATTTTTGDN